MAKRREVRHSLTVPVRIWGMDVTGQMFEQYAIDLTCPIEFVERTGPNWFALLRGNQKLTSEYLRGMKG
jgi:hypothetical protein